MLLHALFLFSILSQCLAQATTIDATTLSDLRRISEYAAAAYCVQNYHAAADKILVLPPNDTESHGSLDIRYPFLDAGERHANGLMMLDYSTAEIVISFKGTATAIDWRTDGALMLTNASSLCGEDCRVHAGFLDSWNGVSEQLLLNWTILQKEYSGYRTVVSGHSLGAALAQLCSMALITLHPAANISLYTYGSPRVGNQVFGAFFDQHLGANNYRVTHLNDPVPRMPPQSWGYVHTGNEYHIVSPHIEDAMNATKAVLRKPENLEVQVRDVLVLPGTANMEGNVGYNCTNVAMHGEYFVAISGCNVPPNSWWYEYFLAFLKSIDVEC